MIVLMMLVRMMTGGPVEAPECRTSADCDGAAGEECYIPAGGRRLDAVCAVCEQEDAAGRCLEWAS